MKLTPGKEREELEAERLRLGHLLVYERRLRREEARIWSRALRHQSRTEERLLRELREAKAAVVEAWKSSREAFAAKTEELERSCARRVTDAQDAARALLDRPPPCDGEPWNYRARGAVQSAPPIPLPRGTVEPADVPPPPGWTQTRNP